MPKDFSPHDWTSAFSYAEEYLTKARNGYSRPIGNNTTLIKNGPDTIAVRYHWTDIVTYHRNGTFTIYGGGWNTVTTKTRIGYYSPVHVYSEAGMWQIGYTGELTPAKVQKCRTCSKTGPTWQEPTWCDITAYWYGRQGMCAGGKEDYAVELQYDPETFAFANWEEHRASRFDQPCLHGEMERHQAEPCEHGLMGKHSTGMRQRTCRRCKGVGKTDYGSKPIPILVTAGQRFVVDATGKLVDDSALTDVVMAQGKAKAYITPSTTKPKAPHAMGSEVRDRLAKVLPGLNERVLHPAAGGTLSIHRIIISLNDTYGWSREEIADWLDTLDTDLRFPAMA